MKLWYNVHFPGKFLFYEWEITSGLELFLACTVIFLIAVVYEALKYLRLYVGIWNEKGKRKLQDAKRDEIVNHETNTRNNNHVSLLNPQKNNRNEDTILGLRRPVFIHICRSLLHMLQIILSYTLMLAAMTFNAYVIASIVAGGGLTMFLFEYPRKREPKFLKELKKVKSEQLLNGGGCH